MTAAGHPAEALQRAADKLRGRAEAATEGPWAHMCLGSEGCLALKAHGTVRERGKSRVARFGQKDWQADHADAEYVTGMHPGVGLALTAWLEETAQWARDNVGDRTCAHDEPCECVIPPLICDLCEEPYTGTRDGCACWDAALKVARALLAPREAGVLPPAAAPAGAAAEAGGGRG